MSNWCWPSIFPARWTPEEFALQRAGYVAALRHPDFLTAVRGGPATAASRSPISNGRARCARRRVVPWQIIDSAESRRRLSRRRSKAGRSDTFRGTSISGALTFRRRPVRRQWLRRLSPRHRHFRRRSEQYRPAGDCRARRRGDERHHRQRPADPDPAVADLCAISTATMPNA